MKYSKLVLPAASLLSIAFLATGCSTSFNPALSGAAGSTQSISLHGKVMGGQQPIYNARIYLFQVSQNTPAVNGGVSAAPSTVYGSPAVSLLTSNTGYPADGNGNYYTQTSNPGGNFSITGDYTCTGGASSQVYLVSEGGDPGIGGTTDNEAAILMEALGSCGNLSSLPFLTMNELSTVAAITSLQQFIGADVTQIGTSTTNVLGVQNAMNVADYLVNMNNGVPTFSTAATTMPVAKIFTLGNAMAACVNSASGSSPACGAFFAAAKNPATNVVPTNTFNAMLNIARYPAADPSDVFMSQPATGASYGSNGLSTAPSDFSLPIVFTSGVLDTPTQVTGAINLAIDQNGYAYVSVCGTSCNIHSATADSLTEVRVGAIPSTSYPGNGTPFGQGSVHFTQELAIDESGYIWGTNDIAGSNGSVTIFSASQTQLSSSPIVNASIVTPHGIAIDTAGNGWITDTGNASIYNLSALGVVTMPFGTNASLATPLNAPFGIVADDNNKLVVSDEGAYNPMTGVVTQAGGLAIFSPGAGVTYNELYTTNGAVTPTAIDLDSDHHIWEIDPNVKKMYRLAESGAPSGAAGSGISIPNALSAQNFTIDGDNNVLIPTCYANCDPAATAGDPSDAIAFLAENGSVISGRSGITDASLANPVSVAVDGSGNAWVASANNGAVTLFVGVAAPLVTPTSLALYSGQIASRP